MPTRTAEAVAATFVRESSPGKEYGPRPFRLRLDADDEARAYVRTPNPVPPGEVPTDVQLEIVAAEEWAGSRTLTVALMNPLGAYRRLTFDVSEAKGVDGTYSSVAVNQAGTTVRWEFDVTTIVAAEHAAGADKFDWQVTTDDTVVRWLKGVGSNKGFPKLVAQTQVVTDKPFDVSPEGIVSVAAPVFEWTAQEDTFEVQLQVGTVDIDGVWDTTTWDSGAVTRTVGRVDTAVDGATGAWAGAADAETYYVRARNHLPSGWSAYSDPIEVTRDAKSALTITNPGATDADPTPPFVHTFGGTQKWWRKIVHRNGVQVADSGQQAGTALTWTPTVAAKRPGDVMTYEARVGDEVARAASEGDPEYTVASVTWTYTPTAVVAGMDTLSVVQDVSDPALSVASSRASVPDEVLFYRAGDVVNRLLGTDDPWLDWTCPPNADVTYGVAAVVNGEASEDVVEVTARLTVTGLWVIEPESERGFRLSGTDLQVVYGDSASTLTPMRAAATVRRVTSLRGLETGFAGQISPTATRSLEDMEADVWWLRENPHLEVRLIVGDLNIPVELDNPFVGFDTGLFFHNRPVKNATFGIRQVGEYPFETI